MIARFDDELQPIFAPNWRSYFEIFETMDDTLNQPMGCLNTACLQISTLRMAENYTLSECACSSFIAFTQYWIERYLLRYVKYPRELKSKLQDGYKILQNRTRGWMSESTKKKMVECLNLVVYEQLHSHSRDLERTSYNPKLLTFQPILPKGLRNRMKKRAKQNRVLDINHCRKIYKFLQPTIFSTLYNCDVIDEGPILKWYAQMEIDLEADISSSSSGDYSDFDPKAILYRIETKTNILKNSSPLMQWIRQDPSDDESLEDSAT